MVKVHATVENYLKTSKKRVENMLDVRKLNGGTYV